MTAKPFKFNEGRALRKLYARALGGRLTLIPEYIGRRITVVPSRHRYAIRTPLGLLICFECWANPSATELVREAAQILIEAGFRCALLDARLSTKWVGERRPFLLAPWNSAVNLEQVAERWMEVRTENLGTPGSQS